MKKGFSLGFLLAILFLIAVASGFMLVWRLFLLAALLIAVSLVWILLGSRAIEARIKLVTGVLQAGDTFTAEIALHNRSRLPGFLLRARLESEVPLDNDVTNLNLLPRRSASWRVNVQCPRRGLYRIGPVTVSSGDPFGIFRRQMSSGKPESLIVYPQTVPLPNFTVARGDPAIITLDSTAGVDVAGVRESRTGDSLKHVHWPSTVHAGKLMVKTFEPERSGQRGRTLWLIADFSREAHVPGVDGGTEEYLVTVTASLANRYIEEEWAVGLLASGADRLLLPPDNGGEQLSRILGVLALAGADAGITLDELVGQEIGRLGQDCSIVLVTPDDKYPLALRKLAVHGNIASVILIDPSSFDQGRDTQHSGPGSERLYIVKRGDDITRTLGDGLGAEANTFGRDAVR